MTEKLYERDSYLREFSAQVQTCEAAEGGFLVTLDRTAFYPEGGGQPCDLGTLGGAAVLDVQLRDGEIVHLCDAALSCGAAVRGEIDWARRFDFMQQHSGEHLVSGLLHAEFGCDNVGFHMGKDMITIDFNVPLDDVALRRIEQKANEAIWADLPTEILYPPAEELPHIFYRSKKELAGQVRIVRFPGVDSCACCGTHVARTGEIGVIQLLSCVKFHDGVRVEMLSGGRCLRYLRRIREENHGVSVMLSAKPMETAAAVARMSRELEAAKQRLTTLEHAEQQRRAEALRGAGDTVLFEAELAPDQVRNLCDKVAKTCGGRCAVFAGADGGWKYAVGGGEADLRPLCKALNAAFSGRGGGKAGFVQGSVQGTRAELERFLAEWNG